MKYIEMTTMLQEEIGEAETSLDDIEETIAVMEEDIYNLRMEMSFVEGRRCLACALLSHLDGKQIAEV